MLNWPLGEAVVGKSRGRGVSKRKEGATVTHIDFWASANRIGLTLLGKSRQWHHLSENPSPLGARTSWRNARFPAAAPTKQHESPITSNCSHPSIHHQLFCFSAALFIIHTVQSINTAKSSPSFMDGLESPPHQLRFAQPQTSIIDVHMARSTRLPP
jgi:hypothetical protein